MFLPQYFLFWFLWQVDSFPLAPYIIMCLEVEHISMGILILQISPWRQLQCYIHTALFGHLLRNLSIVLFPFAMYMYNSVALDDSQWILDSIILLFSYHQIHLLYQIQKCHILDHTNYNLTVNMESWVNKDLVSGTTRRERFPANYNL